jgi:hypothetical protein
VFPLRYGLDSYIPEDGILHSHRREGFLKSCTTLHWYPQGQCHFGFYSIQNVLLMAIHMQGANGQGGSRNRLKTLCITECPPAEGTAVTWHVNWPRRESEHCNLLGYNAMESCRQTCFEVIYVSLFRI